ncbi:hypothetical protein V6N11_041356 [Hibiscus sabdariffa]|uniref:RING-type E3 ubiquitin transferase n=1 Tax=Hibiscus sabdariffa TaxID=183260 RepID=A0ABR2RKL9_9ROSI
MPEVDVSHISLLTGRPASLTTNNQNKRRRLLPRQTVINCDHYINLESTPQSIVRAVASAHYSKVVKEIIKPQPPPREPNFNCPICMGSLTEEMSTSTTDLGPYRAIYKRYMSQQLQPAARYVATVDEGTVHLHICSSIATEFETSLHPVDLGLAPSNPLSKFQLRLINGVSALIRSVTGTYLYRGRKALQLGQKQKRGT